VTTDDDQHQDDELDPEAALVDVIADGNQREADRRRAVRERHGRHEAEADAVVDRVRRPDLTAEEAAQRRADRAERERLRRLLADPD
jgi:hypothetical protein